MIGASYNENRSGRGRERQEKEGQWSCWGAFRDVQWGGDAGGGAVDDFLEWYEVEGVD